MYRNVDYFYRRVCAGHCLQLRCSDIACLNTPLPDGFLNDLLSGGRRQGGNCSAPVEYNRRAAVAEAQADGQEVKHFTD